MTWEKERPLMEPTSSVPIELLSIYTGRWGSVKKSTVIVLIHYCLTIAIAQQGEIGLTYFKKGKIRNTVADSPSPV